MLRKHQLCEVPVAPLPEDQGSDLSVGMAGYTGMQLLGTSEIAPAVPGGTCPGPLLPPTRTQSVIGNGSSGVIRCQLSWVFRTCGLMMH